jgi:hypothetical protein
MIFRVDTDIVTSQLNERLETNFSARLKIRVSADIRKIFFSNAARRRVIRPIETRQRRSIAASALSHAAFDLSLKRELTALASPHRFRRPAVLGR